MRRADIRVIQMGKGAVAGAPREETNILLVDVGRFAALSRQGALVTIIHELAHVAVRKRGYTDAESEAIAIASEVACWGTNPRKNFWALPSWNEMSDKAKKDAAAKQ